MTDLCVFCNRPEADHGPLGTGYRAGPTHRLCPVPGVTSQYFTAPPRHTYVVVEATNRENLVKGKWDLYVTTSSNLDSLLDDAPVGSSYKITVYAWTEAEREAWCEENEVEWEGP